MFLMKYTLYCILIPCIIATSQNNLYYTDGVSENERNNGIRHTCLRILVKNNLGSSDEKVISYCMDQLPSKFHIEDNDYLLKFTFADLLKENITSEQLYLWSAPIDLIEHYQFYLNQSSISNDSLLATEVFYNCTWPRFGLMCEYELIDDPFDEDQLLTLTCYTHLQCNRGSPSICLDWSEICNGKIDCFDNGIDEENCWQLEINECKNNEYRCMNGQCIPKSFHQDIRHSPDCLDASDENMIFIYEYARSSFNKWLYPYEDTVCDLTFLTSSCDEKRISILLNIMFSIKDDFVRDDCWLAYKDLVNDPNMEIAPYGQQCNQIECLEIIEEHCPDMLYIPNVPIFFGDVYIAYKKSDASYYYNTGDYSKRYICYNNPRYNGYFNNVLSISFNNRTCFLQNLNEYTERYHLWNVGYAGRLYQLYRELSIYHRSKNDISTICNKSNMYQCINSSKCISIYRIMNSVPDCPNNDDENITIMNNIELVEKLKKTHFKCSTSNHYISDVLVGDGSCHCGFDKYYWCDDEDTKTFDTRKSISFQTICNGFIQLEPKVINGQNETDETECQQWSCNNIYTRCDGIWNCPNGADEAGCISLSTLNCSSKHHYCISPQTNQLMCLSIERANDGNIDCIGATDEPALCLSKSDRFLYEHQFHCMENTSKLCIHSWLLCNGHNSCNDRLDEQFCKTNGINISIGGLTSSINRYVISDVQIFLSKYLIKPSIPHTIYFQLVETKDLIKDQPKNFEYKLLSSSSINEMPRQYKFRCHHGHNLLVWLNDENNLTKNACLCPPSYYGDQCQYQNQRISLSLQFRALSDSWRTIFAIVISLIDNSDQRIIHSYEQITYISVRDCKKKFNIYLVYAQRSKDTTRNYSIHIDIYEKVSFKYRGSVLLPIYFPFLPVHRLAFIVDIPRSDDTTQDCSHEECIHGKCIKYSNNPQTLSFCQCDEGWSGKYCTIQHTCKCASNSSCIGISANNRSICVCPISKFGSRCLLTNTICQNNDNSTCQNGGQCIPTDDYMLFDQTFTCVCANGFRGERCEITDKNLTLSFNPDIILSQSIFIHFIEVIKNDVPIRSTIFRTLTLRQDSIMIRWSRPFHLVFIELINKNYYLAATSTTIIPSNRCPNISEVFNETFFQWDLLRRIKYYHLPCQNQSLNLSCFYDDVHLCLCHDLIGVDRVANCFNFDHNMTFNCLGQSECENDAQCLQDIPDCPTRSMCICSPCYYGRRCQFSTSGFGLSLDAILGYHILPHVSLTQQPVIVQFSLALTIIFMVVGFVNGILSLITFKNKIICEVGCGLYLLASSITTLLTMTMFGLKFLILILAQMSIISNKTFLEVQCHSFDFILQVCLCMDQWLHACVAGERAVTAIKATRFDKKKSKETAKYVIVIILIIIIGTSIHDPINRHLIDEENDDDEVQRTWCIVRYSSSLQIYNSIMHIFHFFGPFILNFVSAIILITKKSRQQSTIHSQRTYREILREQFLQHKNLLTAPVILVILAVPRLVITFVSKCMKSTNDSWLFLIGYFISFIPPMVTFLVFIVPSKFYKKQFRKSISQYRTTIQRRLHLIS